VNAGLQPDTLFYCLLPENVTMNAESMPGDFRLAATGASPLQAVGHPVLRRHGVRLLVKRDDLTHPVAGGNKWRKLKHNLAEFRASGKAVLVTFGGAWSNHVAATAYAGYRYGIRTAAVIRGERPANPSVTLRRAASQGMELFFVGRATYRDKERAVQPVVAAYGREALFVVPEGGANRAGWTGCLDIVPEIDEPFDALFCPCGTGTTVAGLAASTDRQVFGICVLDDAAGIRRRMDSFLQVDGCPEPAGASRIRVEDAYTFGGYARSTPALEAFVMDFTALTGVPVEPVYSGKMFYALLDLVRQGRFPSGTNLVALHTGGMQYLVA